LRYFVDKVAMDSSSFRRTLELELLVSISTIKLALV
jgi:hypothetical protein